MKIIEAVWEKRNLGVTCAEIEVEGNDSPEDLMPLLRMRSEQYLVVKVSSENYAAVTALQREGFMFIESLIQIEADLSKGAIIPKRCQRLLKNMGWHNSSDEETRKTLEVIRAGSIFATDRISIDPYFSRELAGQRYAYWTEDILASDNSEMLITEYLGENVGFVVMQHREKYSSPVLNGVYPEYLGSGMGVVNSCCTQLYLFQRGVKRSISHISTNNGNMLNMAALFQNSFGDVKHILIKHQ